MVTTTIIYLMIATYPSMSYAIGTRLWTGSFPPRPRFTLFNAGLLIALIGACLGGWQLTRGLQVWHPRLVLVSNGDAEALARDVMSPEVQDFTLRGKDGSGGLLSLPRFSRAVKSPESLQKILEVQTDPPSNSVLVSARAQGLSAIDESVILATLYSSASIVLPHRIASFTIRNEFGFGDGDTGVLGIVSFGIASLAGLAFYVSWFLQNRKESRPAAVATTA